MSGVLGMVALLLVIGAVGFVALGRDAVGTVRDRFLDADGPKVSDLQAGECMQVPPSSETELVNVSTVACDQPHTAEVFAVFDLRGGWTSSDKVEHVVTARCTKRLAGYLGGPPNPLFHVVRLFPADQVAWERDPAAACILAAPGTATNSFKGAAR